MRFLTVGVTDGKGAAVFVVDTEQRVNIRLSEYHTLPATRQLLQDLSATLGMPRSEHADPPVEDVPRGT
jgi:hypothetical protein